MTERFMKVETATGDVVILQRSESGAFLLTTPTGFALLPLADFRRLLAPFPELREATRVEDTRLLSPKVTLPMSCANPACGHPKDEHHPQALGGDVCRHVLGREVIRPTPVYCGCTGFVDAPKDHFFCEHSERPEARWPCKVKRDGLAEK